MKQLFRTKNFIALVFLLVEFSAVSSTKLECDFHKNSRIRIQVLKDDIVRIQIIPQGGVFRESLLNNYGFIQDFKNDDLKIDVKENKNDFSIETSKLRLKGSKLTGKIVTTDFTGEKVLLRQMSVDFKDHLSSVKFTADKNENWIGFGDQSRDRIYQRGHMADCFVRNVKSYIPVPFFMSTLGTGILVNTTSRVVFDMCKSSTENYSCVNNNGTVDYYLMVGKGFSDLINLYTELTGRPKLPPEWAFGLWYICRTQANDYEAVNDALNFRREGIPCDVIGLEPGWMDKNYDSSTAKTWSKERFPIPRWAKNGPYNFINSIKRMGFKLELWLCNDYDLTYEEERQIGKKKSVSIEDLTGKLPSGFEIDEHMTASTYMDKLTIKDELWFSHLKKFIDQGVDFFKQDGANQVSEHPDRLWGMTDGEVHNLYPLIYARQMYQGFKEYTNRRPVVFTPCGYTGFQAWAGTWTGDTGGGLTTLGAMLNISITGYSWAINDMDVENKEGIHFGYLQPWSQINSWTYFDMPWVQGTELTQMHKYYSNLRSKLIPYLYSWAYNATKTGWPMLLPLTLEFPDDKNCRNNLHQYLLGRDLMIGVYNKTVYFPSGRWKDYWTGEVVDGLQEKDVTWPDDKGGSLYIRSGGIIPLGPVIQYRGEKPLDEITLYVFPAEKETSLDFYEDDGVSLNHLKGEYSITQIRTRTNGSISTVGIGASEGSFKGKVENRRWNILMHSDNKPSIVECNGKQLTADKYSWDEKRSFNKWIIGFNRGCN